MSEFFDLGNLKELIEKDPLATVFIIDTNMVMNNPDLRKWNIDVKPSVFVVPFLVMRELEAKKNRINEKKDPSAEDIAKRDEISNANKGIAELCKIGRISEGIKVKNNWVIIVNAYEGVWNSETLHKEKQRLMKMTLLTGEDPIFLLFIQQCINEFPRNNVILLTGDIGLSNIAGGIGLNAYAGRYFPLRMKKYLQNLKVLLPVNWDKVLVEAHKKLESLSWHVDLTLISKRLELSKSEEDDDVEKAVIVAEGFGLIHDTDKNINFLWRMPYKHNVPKDTIGETVRYKYDVVDYCYSPDWHGDDFRDLHADQINISSDADMNQTLLKNLKTELSHFCRPYNKYDITLQGPLSCIAHYFTACKVEELLFTPGYEQEPGCEADNIDHGSPAFGSYEELTEYVYRELRSSTDTAGHFFMGLAQSWDIGQTVQLDILGKK